jgi:serine/threonine-protein kinase RsbW
VTSTSVRSLRVAADVRELADVRALVRSEAVAAGADEPFVSDLVQAVDETASNAIIHGHDGRPGWIEVGVARDGDRLVVTIEDDAPAFDPTTVPEPDLTIPPDQRRPGGMGVHLARLCVDEMSYRPRPAGGNILTLVRKLDAHAKEDR